MLYDNLNVIDAAQLGAVAESPSRPRATAPLVGCVTWRTASHAKEPRPRPNDHRAPTDMPIYPHTASICNAPCSTSPGCRALYVHADFGLACTRADASICTAHAGLQEHAMPWSKQRNVQHVECRSGPPPPADVKDGGSRWPKPVRPAAFHRLTEGREPM